MRIPNQFLDEFINPTELKVACVIYSLISPRTKSNLMGYELRIKQETLCSYCNVSLPTLKKAVGSLIAKGFIISMQRSTYGIRKGTCIYTVKRYSLENDYFISDRVFFRLLSGNTFRLYMHFCRFAGIDRKFYHSYNDLADRLGLDRREIIKCVSKLVKQKLIYKACKLTGQGDYTDNTYIVYRYRRGRLKKRRYKVKRLFTVAPVKSQNELINSNNSSNHRDYILPDFYRFVKGKKHDFYELFGVKGVVTIFDSG